MLEVVAPSANAQGVSDVLHAVASLAWPTVALVGLLLFRSELADLIKRVRSVKAPGGTEIQIREELDVVEESVEEAAESVSGPRPEPREAPVPSSSEARRSRRFRPVPKLALLDLADQIERRSRDLLLSRGQADAWEGHTLTERVTRLDASPPVQAAARQFDLVCSQVLHDVDVSDEVVRRTIEVGQELLQALERIPNEVHYVREPRVELFADAEGNVPYGGTPSVRGVLLESVSSEGGTIVHAFPTTLNHFERGKPVSWEWGGGNFEEAWYRDPADGEMKYGWTNSLEFRGRPLDSVY